MSNLLAQYANNITQSAANVSNAYAQKANAQAHAQQASAQSIGNLQNTLQAQEQNKLQAQQIQAQKEVGLAQIEQEGSFMRMLMAKDRGLNDSQIQELEDNRQAKMQEQLKANANIPTTGLEAAVVGVGAIGAGAGKVGKWAWSHTFGEKAKARRAEKKDIAQAIQTGSQKVMQDFYKQNPQLNVLKRPPKAPSGMRTGMPNFMPVSQSELTK